MTDTDDSNWSRLCVIAGGGRLPFLLATAEHEAGRPPFVIGLNGFADHDYTSFEQQRFNMGAIGGIQDAARAAGCDAVCFAGTVKRPDLKTLRPADMTTMKLMPKVISAGMKGDDGLLRVVLEAFEKAGFRVVGAHDVAGDLVASSGVLGAIEPDEENSRDAVKALEIARAIGTLDIGQGAVVCDGLVLAVEAQEGTDAMLARIPALPEDIRGRSGALRGVLAKASKPIQERRMDLPVIGTATVEGVLNAGLAGIVIEANGALIVDRPAVIAAADTAGVFVIAVSVDRT